MPTDLKITVTDVTSQPLLHKDSPGAEDNRYGFEGGHVVKVDDQYYLFTCEVHGEPKVVKTRLAIWISQDGLDFKRHSTLVEGSGDYTGQDDRASPWAPIPFYNDQQKCWQVFYVTYRAEPDTSTETRRNIDGKIIELNSQTPGKEGICGPYIEKRTILQMDRDSDWWEGLQGTDSFFPFKTNNGLLAFYGSNRYMHEAYELPHRKKWFGVGLVKHNAAEDKWERLYDYSPVLINHRFVENPIVQKIRSNHLPDITEDCYLALYDSAQGAFGYSFSTNGLEWSKEKTFDLGKQKPAWVSIPRTVLSVIPEDHGQYAVYFTSFDTKPFELNLDPQYHCGFENVGRLLIKIRS